MAHRYCTPWQVSKKKCVFGTSIHPCLPTFPTVPRHAQPVPLPLSNEHLHGYDVAPHHRIPHAGSTDECSGRDGVSNFPNATTPLTNAPNATKKCVLVPSLCHPLPTFLTVPRHDQPVPLSLSNEHLRGYDMAPHHRIPHSGSTDECSGRNGVSHVPKAKTPSSNRQKAAFIKAAVTTATSAKRAKQNKARRANNKAKKQAQNMYIHRDRCGFHIPHSQTSKSPVSKFNFEPTLLFGVRSCHGHGLVVVCGRWLLQLHPTNTYTQLSTNMGKINSVHTYHTFKTHTFICEFSFSNVQIY